MAMTVGDLMDQLEDLDPNTEIKLGLQPRYPMIGRIRNLCVERDAHGDEIRLWIACSDNENYGCPREIWEDSEIFPDNDDDDI